MMECIVRASHVSLIWSSCVDSMFKQSENVTIAVVSLSSCCWPASRGVVYELIGSKFMLLHVHCTNSWHTARDCLDFLWVCELTVVHISHIIPWLWHQTYMYLSPVINIIMSTAYIQCTCTCTCAMCLNWLILQVHVLERMGGMQENCHTCHLLDVSNVKGMSHHYGNSSTLPSSLESLCKNELPKGRKG